MNTANKVKENLIALASIADRENQQVYLVGGTLRDFMLGKTSADYDFTGVDAPTLAKVFARETKYPLVPLDNTPGRETFRVVVEKNLYFDFSRLQGKTLDEDLSRRDFTFNAMAISLKEFLAGSRAIIDPHRGVDDLRDRIIRVLPGDIFYDDPLRMVRAFRFASTLDFSIEAATLAKISECKDQLERVAFERINYELFLLLRSSNACSHIILMDKIGLLGQIFPELSIMTSNPDGMIAWRQSLQAFQFIETLDNSQDVIRKLVESLGEKESSLLKMASILHRLPDAIPALKRLRTSNSEISFIENAIKGQLKTLAEFETFSQNNESAIYRFVRQCGNELIPALILALGAYCARNHLCATPANPFAGAVLKVYDFYVNRYLPAQKRPAFLNGDDLINQFKIAPSPRFQTILDQVEESRVLGIIKTRKEAEAFARNLIDN